MVTYSPLPRVGDKVSIQNVEGPKSSELNGKTGVVKNFFLDQGSKYEIQVRRSNKDKVKSKSKSKNRTKGPTKDLIKASNLCVELEKKHQDQDDEDLSSIDKNKVHVLIPCHVDCERDALFFLRCIQSVGEQQCASMHQEGSADSDESFHVFVGLSGPQKHRESVLNILLAVSSQAENSRWHVISVEEEEEGASAIATGKRSAKFEHLRHLVDLSASINPNAQLLFIEKDAMMHPLRMIVFQEGKKNLNIPEDCPFTLSCKLLLGDSVTAEEGQIGRLITTSKDFDFWKVDPAFQEEGKITWISTTSCEVMEAEEYFDYMVPTSILQKFFHLNPTKVTSHKYCDLRWLEILKVIAPMEVVDMPTYPWLLAHYKAFSRSAKKTQLKLSMSATTDQKKDESQPDSFPDSNPISTPEALEKDEDIAKRYPPLTPVQAANCRSYFESIILPYYGWSNQSLAAVRDDVIKYVNSTVNIADGAFGEELWTQVEEEIASYFNEDPDKLDESREAWVPLLKHRRGCQIM